jgi:HEAT repeat protein
MRKIIVLLDVDETSVMSNSHYGQHDGGYRYNEALFEALRTHNLTELYLFNSYVLKGIAKNKEEEPIAAPSRIKLIEFLATQGIKVLGVLTLLDPIFNQGPGAYYEKIIKDFEAQVLNGTDMRKEGENKKYSELCATEDTLWQQATFKKIDDKAYLYLYFKNYLKNTLLYDDPAFIVVDDSKPAIDSIQKGNPSTVSLLTLLAKPQTTVEDYKGAFGKFIYQVCWQDTKAKLDKVLPLVDKKNKLEQKRIDEYQRLTKTLSALENKNVFSVLEALEHSVAAYVADLNEQVQLLPAINPLPPVAVPITTIEDSGTEELIRAIQSLAEKERSDVPQAVIYGLKQPFHLSIAKASKILSLTEQEFLLENPENVIPQRGNNTGTNYVTKLNNIFFKRNERGSGYFLREQAVYQASLLLGGGIVAPTRMLVIETPNKSKMIVQAGFAIGGENLEDVLCLPEVMANLGKLIDAFRKDFPDLVNERYLHSWLIQQGHDSNMPLPQQKKLFVETLYSLPRNKRPLEFKESFSMEAITKDLQGILKSRPILPTLALMAKYPEMVGKVDLAFLLHVPIILKLLTRLYPKNTPEEILLQVPKLFQKFDAENLSRQFLLAILTEPSDHKGDNFKVLIEHDARGQLQALKMVAIDNDEAMQGSIIGFESMRNKNNDNSIQRTNLIKTFLYGVEDFVAAPFASKARQLLLETPKTKVSHWVAAMADYSENCINIITEQLSQEHNLEEAASFNFIERLRLRLEKIQSVLQNRLKLTHEELLIGVEPLLGVYFQELRAKYSGLQNFMFALYEKPESSSLTYLLDERLKERYEGETLQVHLTRILPKASESYSYRQALKKFIIKHELLSPQSPAFQETLRLLLTLDVKRDAEWFKDQTLTIPLGSFTKLYSEKSEAFITLMRTFRVVLFVVPNVQLALFPSNSYLFYHAVKMDAALPAIQALLAYDVPLSNANLPDGSTLLHFAAIYCPLAISVFLQAGVQTEAQDVAGKTALDWAIEYPNLESVKLLLTAGAGQFVTLQNGLQFVRQHNRRFPQLCQLLLNRNGDICWKLALERISQDKKNSEEVILEGLGGTRYLCSDIYKQIFKHGTDSITKENPYGRHNVTSIKCLITEGVTVGLHLKENPELLGREMMVHYLAKNLFGHITPAVALWRFSKEEGIFKKTKISYPVLASRSIVGSNLKEALEHHPDQLQNLDHESFSEALVLALLINPEDGRGDNYILQPFTMNNKTRYRIISIDNDHAFVRPLKLDKEGQEIEGPQGLQVKTILYCLNEMQMPLYPRVRERLLKIDAHQLLDTWLQDLEVAQKQTDRLFKAEEKARLKAAGIHLDIEFKPSIVLDLYEKLLRVQTLLTKLPESSGLTLLRYTIPSLSLRYITAFEQYSTVMERFNALTKGCFEIQVVKVQNDTNMDIYIWPKSKVSLEQTPDIQGNAIVVAKEELDTLVPLPANFIRNGQWVTSTEKEVTVLKSVPVDFRTLINFSVKQNGLLDKNEKNKKEVEALIEQTMTRIKFNKEHEFSKTKTVDIIQMTKATLAKELKIEAEKAETPVIARASLKTIHEQLSNLKAVRDALQQGNVLKFRLLQSTDHQEWVVNGRGVESPGIDFAAVKLPNQEPDIAKQEKVLGALAEVEFRSLRIQGCAALTDRVLGSLVRNSRGLLALSLVDCPQLTDVALINISKACPQLEKLELKGLNLVQAQPSFSKLRVLRIKNCEKLKVWQGEVPSLNKFETQGCPLFPDPAFYSSYSFLLSLSGHLSSDIKNVHTLIQTLLKEKNVSARALSIQIRRGILNTLNQYWQGIAKVDCEAIAQSLIKKLNNSISNKNEVRVAAARGLGALSVQLPERMVRGVTETLLAVLEDRDSYVRDGVAKELGALSARLPGRMVKVVVEALLATLKDRDSYAKQVAEKELGALSARLPEGIVNGVSEALLEALKDANSDVRAAAAKELGVLSARMPGGMFKGVSEALLVALKDAHSDVRVAAAKGLGVLSARMPEGLVKEVSESLLAVLKDQDPYVRKAAANALGMLSTMFPEVMVNRAIEALLGMLKDAHSDVREAAANALGLLSVRMPEGIVKGLSEALLAALKDEREVRRAAANGLGVLSARLPDGIIKEVSEALLTTLKDEQEVRRAAANALGLLSARLPDGMIKEVSEALLSTLKDKDSWSVREAVANALGLLSIRMPEGMLKGVSEALLVALKSKHWFARVAPEEALSALSARLPERAVKGFCEVLLVALKDESSGVKQTAAKELGALSARMSEGMFKGVSEALLATLKDEDSDVRQAAENALGALSTRMPEQVVNRFCEVLLAALKDEDSDVRQAAANALTALSARMPKGTVEKVSEALLTALQNEHLEVRQAVARGLGALSVHLPEGMVKGVSKALLETLKDEQWYVREAAANALGALSARLPGGLVKWFCEVLLAALNDIDSNVRQAAANELGALSARMSEGMVKKVTEALLAALNDIDSNVRQAAANALGLLSARMSAGMVKRVSEGLLAALKDGFYRYYVRQAAAKTLDALSARLPGEMVNEVTEALLAVLEDEDSYVRKAAAKALDGLSAQLPVERVKEVTEALLAALKDKDAWRVREAAAKALGMLNARLPGPVERVKEVTEALLAALKDKDSWDVRRAAANALGLLSARMSEWMVKGVSEGLLVAMKDEDLDVRKAAANALRVLGTRDLQFVVSQLLNALNDKTFDLGSDAIIETLTYLMSNEYFDKIVAGKIRNFFFPVTIVPSIISNNSIEVIKGPNQDTVTLPDGNCAINTFALGICDIVLQNKDRLANNKIKTLLDGLNPLFLQQAGLTLLTWLEKETDNDKRQAMLAPILRELAVEYIESHIDYYKESYEAGLLAAFEQYKLNQPEDTFSVHSHIRKKFDELNRLVNVRNQNPDIKEMKEGQETQALLAWWNKGIGKNPSGFQEYLSHLKLPARGAGDRERWGSEVEIGALAFRLGITIKNRKSGIKVGQEQLLGVGYGCILGLSESEIQHLGDLDIGSRFQGNFRIEVADAQELTRRLELEKLTEAEKAYLDQNGRETILAFMVNSRSYPVAERKGMQELCDKLKRIGLFVRSKNQGLRFVNDAVLKSRLTPVAETLKKKVLAAHLKPPCFSITHVGVHWSYLKEDTIKTNKNPLVVTPAIAVKQGVEQDKKEKEMSWENQEVKEEHWDSKETKERQEEQGFDAEVYDTGQWGRNRSVAVVDPYKGSAPLPLTFSSEASAHSQPLGNTSTPVTILPQSLQNKF